MCIKKRERMALWATPRPVHTVPREVEMEIGVKKQKEEDWLAQGYIWWTVYVGP